jgi:hypothetical protein
MAREVILTERFDEAAISALATPKAVPCPACGSADVTEILWGMPGPGTIEEAERRGAILGGCCIDANAPGFHCDRCGSRWPDPLYADQR